MTLHVVVGGASERQQRQDTLLKREPMPAGAERPPYVTSLGQRFRAPSARLCWLLQPNLSVAKDITGPVHNTSHHTTTQHAMSSREPPWRNERNKHAQRNGPASSIPAKRSADPPCHDSAAKRSTNAAEEAWVADEDRFVLQQAKKKAALRVRGGRAKPIDWLAVTLRFIDPAEKSILDEEVEDHELDIVDPEGVLEGLDNEDLAELEKEIDNYLTLETSRSNRDYWTVSINMPRCPSSSNHTSHSKPFARTFAASPARQKPRREALAP